MTPDDAENNNGYTFRMFTVLYEELHHAINSLGDLRIINNHQILLCIYPVLSFIYLGRKKVNFFIRFSLG